MKSYQTTRAAIFSLLPPLAALAAAGCSGKTAQPMAREAVPVIIATVAQKTVPVQVRVIGTAQAYATVSVKTQVSGELTEVLFQEGQDVKKGDLLFVIDPRPFEEALKQAQANLARDTAQWKQAEANLARDTAQLQNAEAEARRYQDLVRQGIVAQEVYDRIRTTADAQRAGVNAGRAAMENAEAAARADRAAIENARIQLGYCSIHSPIDGRTGSLLVHRGNIVKANDTVLVVINQINPIYVSFSVPEQYLAEIKKYMAGGRLQVEALIPNEENRPERGTLTFVDNAVDAGTGTIRLKGTFSNTGRRLWPGLFVNVVLTLSSRPDAIVVPSQAVQTGQEGQFVFVVKADSTAEARRVVVARAVEGETVIEKGLRPGEKVVIDGQLRLVPGAKVEVKNSRGSQEIRS